MKTWRSLATRERSIAALRASCPQGKRPPGTDHGGATKSEVARAVGTSRETIYGWGRHHPSLELLIAAFNHLGYELRAVALDTAAEIEAPIIAFGREIKADDLPPARRRVLRFLASQTDASGAAHAVSAETIAESVGDKLESVRVYLVAVRKTLLAQGLDVENAGPWGNARYRLVRAKT